MVKRMMDLIEELRLTIPEVTVSQLRERLDAGEDLILLDVREAPEVEELGAIAGAVCIPRGFIEMRMEKVTLDPEATIIVYCMVGHRSLLAAQTLIAMGYENAVSLAGGYIEWQETLDD